MRLKISYEAGKKSLEVKEGQTIHQALQTNHINVQNYLIRHGQEIISEKEVIQKDMTLELIKIVSGG